MSAWIVSKEHIDVLINAGLRRLGTIAFSWYSKAEGRRIQLDLSNATQVGQMLWDENHRSVNYRYNEDETAPTYRYQLMSKHVDVVPALKLLASYEYQTCEHPDWETSEAKALCDSLRIHLVNMLPGYDKAPWSI